MSAENGRILYQLSKDHKPSQPEERDRVLDSGGKIYVSAIKQTMGVSGTTLHRTDKLISKNDTLTSSTDNALSVIESGGEAYGPHRVLPGRLSVSRAIGDAHAKLKQLGGNPHVVIARPDIKKFKIYHSYDFIVMGSDGLFDKQSNSDIVKSVYRKAVDVFNNETKDLSKVAIS
jgi:serine/threonine protein phosphatase PrpC